MKATWNDTLIAEAPKEDLVRIEGNWYFPGASINKEYFTPSETHTTCFWKGDASYYDVNVDGQVNKDAAWYYPVPLEGATQRVGRDFTDYVAFWHGVEVTE